jgi:transposase-like protein
MPRTYKRKTERANTAPDTVLRAVRAVRIENRSIRSVARDFGIPFRSLTRYCSRASEDDIRGISQNPTFSIGYKKTHQVSSG